MKLLFWSIAVSVAGFALSLSGQCQARNVIVRPKEIHDILVNPGMGITTFQRLNRQAIYPGLRWSEVGPEGPVADSPTKPEFPGTSIAYLRWFWHQIEPASGAALARQHH